MDCFDCGWKSSRFWSHSSYRYRYGYCKKSFCLGVLIFWLFEIWLSPKPSYPQGCVLVWDPKRRSGSIKFSMRTSNERTPVALSIRPRQKNWENKNRNLGVPDVLCIKIMGHFLPLFTDENARRRILLMMRGLLVHLLTVLHLASRAARGKLGPHNMFHRAAVA